MAMSDNEREEMNNRFLALERAFNDLQTALLNLATKQQLKSLLNVRQSEIEDLKTRVTNLENAP